MFGRNLLSVVVLAMSVMSARAGYGRGPLGEVVAPPIVKPPIIRPPIIQPVVKTVIQPVVYQPVIKPIVEPEVNPTLVKQTQVLPVRVGGGFDGGPIGGDSGVGDNGGIPTAGSGVGTGIIGPDYPVHGNHKGPEKIVGARQTGTY